MALQELSTIQEKTERKLCEVWIHAADELLQSETVC